MFSKISEPGTKRPESYTSEEYFNLPFLVERKSTRGNNFFKYIKTFLSI